MILIRAWNCCLIGLTIYNLILSRTPFEGFFTTKIFMLLSVKLIWVIIVIIEYITDKIIGNDRLIFSAMGCAILYILISKENITQRLISGTAGFLAAIMFSPLLAETLSDGKGAHIYSAGIALCGQFVPQLIQTCITKIKHTDVYAIITRLFKK